MARTERIQKEHRRTEAVNFKVSPEEFEVIENYAKKQDLTVSQVCRGAIFMDMIMNGHGPAIKLVGAMVKEQIKSDLSEQFDIFRAAVVKKLV